MPSNEVIETRCPAGVTAEQLSTWRARGLEGDEAERLAAHVPACPICQAQLAAYDEIGAQLRAQPVPAADEQLWEELEPRLAMGSFGWRNLPVLVAARTALQSAWRERSMAGSQRVSAPVATDHARPARPSRPSRALGAVALAAAVLLVIVGFATVLRERGAPPPLTLSWRQLTLPTEANAQLLDLTSFSSNIGPGAYVCLLAGGTGSNQAVHVYVTRDAGTHWTRGGDVPVEHTEISDCNILVDDLNPDIAEATVSWNGVPVVPPPGPVTEASFVTTDGGAAWRPLSGMPDGFVFVQFATWHGVTYGVAGEVHLYVSRDGLKTWQPVPVPPHNATTHTMQLWVRPDSGELLASLHDFEHDQESVWLSDDGGQHWSQMMTPRELLFQVQPPIAGQPWRLCGMHYVVGQDPEDTLDCSWDGGRSWANYPVPTQLAGMWIAGITPSGDLIAESNHSGHSVVYRLASGSTQWQPLNLPPLAAPTVGTAVFAVSYLPRRNGGALWGEAMQFPVQGRQGILKAIYVAAYPGG